MFVVQRVLLKGGKIKNNLSNWDTAASVVVETMLLQRGTLKAALESKEGELYILVSICRTTHVPHL